MKFTEMLWDAALPVYEKIRLHPFNQELMAGTLPIEKFKFYIHQDSLYLADFARALATVGTRSSESQDLLDFLQFAQHAILVERALHMEYFQQYEFKFENGKAPGCFSYTSYLLAVSAFESYETAVAALLPCFCIYKKIGDDMVAGQTMPNAYQRWIDAYAGEDFAASVEKAVSICDRFAGSASESTRLRMKEAYLTACRLEYLFWDSAYRLERWAV
jgi:thiaminase/transcriptional activator TenA